MSRRRIDRILGLAAVALVACAALSCESPLLADPGGAPGGSGAEASGESRGWLFGDDDPAEGGTIPAGLSALSSPDGKGSAVVLDEASGKYLVRLKGSGYAMGYQHGYLLAEKVKATCSLDFFRAIVSDFLGSDPTLAAVIANDALFGTILNTVQGLALTQTFFATYDMRQEMRGVADGAKRRLSELGLGSGSVSYERVVLMNMAFDVILSYVYPTIVNDYLSADEKAAVDERALVDRMHMCDGFVAGPGSAAAGGTVMTRSFMITDLLGASSVIMEYDPSSGNEFVAVNPPGFVGTPAGMNSSGVSIGMDMVPALSTNAAAPGMGCLLTARYVLQNADSVSEAMSSIRNSVARGVPWMYVVADTQGGAVAEAAATSGLGWLSPDRFAARYLDYDFDPSAYPEQGIDQLEDRDDLVVLTNHFIDPTVREASGSYAVDESKARYDYLVPTVIAELDAGLDVADAKALANYLSPLADNPYGDDVMDNPFGEGTALVGDFYAGTEYVHGIRAVFLPGTKTMHVLYGYWTDPWVEYSLPF